MHFDHFNEELSEEKKIDHHHFFIIVKDMLGL
jgi:hypothetical protein